MGKSWKETRLRLYNAYFEPTFTTKQNIENRPPGIDREHLRWFLDYRAKPETKSEQQGRIVGRGELWIAVHKKKDGSYMNDEARAIGLTLIVIVNLPVMFIDFLNFDERIEEIEQQDESSRVLSQNDSIAQVFGKEKPGRVRGVGFGPTPSQLFGPNSHGPGNGVQQEETQRKLLELEAQLEGEKLKRKAMESALIYLFQRQGEELPPDIAAGMSFVG
ncbi:uncharacterized protein LOC130963313 [Arachis stenosperma]|uniref:uncharacterized protein LOC130963313 n=1 Tax=Arachis stenosperma TaxID=217475 RepID=UPI0025AD030A|nr:uncharacterized protein LOC130963313 [Arachis stenosperma]